MNYSFKNRVVQSVVGYNYDLIYKILKKKQSKNTRDVDSLFIYI